MTGAIGRRPLLSWPASKSKTTSTTRATRRTTPSPRLADPVEAASGGARRPSLWTALDARAKERADPSMAQLRGRVEERLDFSALDGLFDPAGNDSAEPMVGAGGEAPMGGFGLSGPSGAQAHSMVSEQGRASARAALGEEGTIRTDHPYAAEKEGTRRRLGQLGVPLSNDNRLHVYDVSSKHGNAVTRTLAGRTALVPGAAVTLDVPMEEALDTARGVSPERGERSSDPTTDDLVQEAADSLIGNASDLGLTLTDLARTNAEQGDGRKTFVNMSVGRAPEAEARDIANRMMAAEPGTALYNEAVTVLGRAPRLDELDGSVTPNRDDVVKIQRDLVVPALEARMATPEFQEQMGAARVFLKTAADDARQNGVMVFQAAGNGYTSANATGNAALSEGVMSNVDGIFRVGATVPNGPGADDDTLAAFSAAGPIDASATGMAIPVGVDAGRAMDVGGTSFSSPIMTETAYVISGANSELSLQGIEDVLKDPRVARDVEGQIRDGAGSVDQFAAVLVAMNPTITRDQIVKVRATLDADPSAKFTLQPDGALRGRGL